MKSHLVFIDAAGSPERAFGCAVADAECRGSGRVATAFCWAVLLAAILLCASPQVSAQVCVSERQQVMAANNGKTPSGDTDEMMKDVNNRVESLWDIRDPQRCPASLKARCDAMPKGINAGSPLYGDALRLQAEIELYKASRETHPGIATQMVWSACLARHMADQLKSKTRRPYQ
jgi:hypothetical protein